MKFSRSFLVLFATSCLLCLTTLQVVAQDADSQALFASIGDDLKSGDAAAFSSWFAEDLEVDVLGSAGICSKNQAKQTMKDFYAKYTPKVFSVVHISGALPMRYCIGTLLAGGEKFRVTLFVKTLRGEHTIQQMRIEKD